MSVTPELRAELREKARELVATFPPLTGEQLADIRRIFAPDPQTADEPLSPRGSTRARRPARKTA